MSFLLTPEQAAFRDAALVSNLRFKFPRVHNYPDAVLVRAYNDWYGTAEDDNEEDFLEFIKPPLDE